MSKVVRLRTNREYYQLADAMNDSITISELIDALSNCPSDAKVVFSNDGGYTYGYITEDVILY